MPQFKRPSDITDTDLITAVRLVAAQAPDFVYTKSEDGKCDYHPTPGNPQGCIIGAALYDLTGYHHQSLDVARIHLKNLGTNLSEDTLEWADNVQCWQDAGKTWAESVANADVNLTPEEDPR